MKQTKVEWREIDEEGWRDIDRDGMERYRLRDVERDGEIGWGDIDGEIYSIERDIEMGCRYRQRYGKIGWRERWGDIDGEI